MPDIAAPQQLRDQAGILYANQAVIIDNADGEFINVGAPLEIPTYSEGITDEIINFVKYGVSNPSGLRRTANEPLLSYPAGPNPGSMAIGRAKKVVAQSVETPIQVGPFLIEEAALTAGGGIIDLGGTNVDGDGIADDLAGGRGFFYSESTDIVEATAVAFAGTPTAGQFAQGAGRQFKFDAADAGKQFVFFAEQRGAESVLEATETAIQTVRLYLEYVLSDQRILCLDAPTCIPRPNGDLISGNPVNLQFLFTRSASLCTLGPRIYFRGNDQLFLELC